MNLHRRILMQNLGISTIGLAFAAGTTPAMAGEDVKIVPLSDGRVQQFLLYRKEVKKNTVATIDQYTAPDFTYVSSTGQFFDREGLAKRIEEWAKGFTIISSQGDWAVAIGASELLIATTDVLLHSGEFRGNAATHNKLETKSLFLIDYTDSGKFSTYTRFSNYGVIAKAVGAKQLDMLHGI